ncbi:MAG: amidohydrolase family protein [Deltaproteobacteria bacterium]|nr:amidohydrolase family protein [Deltaproteobacteria bacterium]
MIIDIAAHYISKPVQKMFSENPQFGKAAQFPFPSKHADPEVRLGVMDKYGVDMQALLAHTWSTPPVLKAFTDEELDKIRRITNDENFKLCKAYPDRFVNICIVSLLDMKIALDELDRCINELDCRAITIATNQKGKGIDSSEYFPFYERLVEHDLPLFLHPTNWENYYPLVDMKNGWRMMHVFGWPFDTTQAVWRLIFGGVLDRYPSLKVITHHLGGMLPYFKRRIEINVEKFLDESLPMHITEYWKNIYGDAALDGTVEAYPCGYAFFGPDRMMYGTDYPYGHEEGEDFIRENLAGIRAMDIPEEDMEKILGRNAMRLFKIR